MELSKEAMEANILAQAKEMGLSEEEITGDVKTDNPHPDLNPPADKPDSEVEEVKAESKAEPENPSEPETKENKEPKTETEAQKAFREREANRAEMRQQIADLQAQLAEVKTAVGGKKLDEAVDEYQAKLKAFGEENDVSPEGLAKLTELMAEGVAKKIGISTDKLKMLEVLPNVVEKISKQTAQAEQETFYNNEWEKFIPSLKKEFPNASEEQLKKAKAEMQKLATSETYGLVAGKHEAYPLEYIYFKEKPKLNDILFSPKRKTAESGHLGNTDDLPDTPTNLNDLGNLTPQSIEKATKEIDAFYAKK